MTSGTVRSVLIIGAAAALIFSGSSARGQVPGANPPVPPFTEDQGDENSGLSPTEEAVLKEVGAACSDEADKLVAKDPPSKHYPSFFPNVNGTFVNRNTHVDELITVCIYEEAPFHPELRRLYPNETTPQKSSM